METYCVSCKKNTGNKNSSARKTKQNKLMLLSNCAFCGKKIFTKNKKISNYWIIMKKKTTNFY